MKKIIALMLAVLLLFSLIGCSKETNQETNDSSSSNSQSQNNQTENTNQTEGTTGQNEEITPENWGASERWIAGKTAESKPFYINFPKYAGYTEGYGLVAEQTDGTVVIVAGEFDNSPDVDNLKDFLPAYFDDVQYTLEKIYGLLSENYEFIVKTDMAVTVGEYAMHVFDGTFSFDEDGKHIEYQYVVYATQLKSNGAYAYWVVYDVSDDQSKGQLIAEHALNMAKTFREEQ